MKKQILMILAVFGMTLSGVSQNTVTVDVNAQWVGYANIFDPATGGYLFGETWGLSDIKSVVDVSGMSVTLQPNFNTYGDGTDPYWVDQGTGEGAKIFEGNSYIEDSSLAGSELTFTGFVDSNTLDAAYTSLAFIKVFNANFTELKIETVELVAGQPFEVNYTNVEAPDTTVQYGFQVTGLNANPADEAALGSVVVMPASLNVDSFDAVSLSVSPNPSDVAWTIRGANSDIVSVNLVDVLGKTVASYQAQGASVSINNQGLSKGVYFAQVQTSIGSKTIKLLKK
jgi:hypothetical protein